jgi:hypothetical protein
MGYGVSKRFNKSEARASTYYREGEIIYLQIVRRVSEYLGL